MIQKLFALFSTPAVSLQAARETIEQSRATLDSVQAMFAAAGLNLEQMLEAGPDALKAHLASLDHSEAITDLQTKLATAEAGQTTLREELTAAKSAHEVTSAALQVHAELLASTGFKAESGATAEALKTAFAAHVEQQAASVLARDGRAAVPHLTAEQIAEGEKAAQAAAVVQSKRDQLSGHYEAMAKLPPEQQRDYFLKHIKPLQA